MMFRARDGSVVRGKRWTRGLRNTASGYSLLASSPVLREQRWMGPLDFAEWPRAGSEGLAVMSLSNEEPGSENRRARFHSENHGLEACDWTGSRLRRGPEFSHSVKFAGTLSCGGSDSSNFAVAGESNETNSCSCGVRHFAQCVFRKSGWLRRLVRFDDNTLPPVVPSILEFCGESDDHYIRSKRNVDGSLYGRHAA